MIRLLTQEEVPRFWSEAQKQNAIDAPFFSYEWHNLWHEVLGPEWELYPLLINDDVIAPMARKEDEVIFSGGQEIADYLDLIGPDDKKTAVWDEIIPFLKTQGVSKIHLRNIPESSPTMRYFNERINNDISVEKEDTTPIIHLPKTWEEYLALLSRKDKHELERKIRKFEREHANFSIEESKNPETDINELLRLMKMDREKVVFLISIMETFFHKIATSFASDISLLLLRIDGEVAASTLSFRSSSGFLLYNSGFDPICCTNAGFYLKAMGVKRAVEKGDAQYNFLQGNERYKYELGAKDFFVYTIHTNL